jgi:hypothetical protein
MFKRVINVISVLYMGTKINKFIPLPPAQMKYPEAAQQKVLKGYNTTNI